jgi:hypothetical protein
MVSMKHERLSFHLSQLATQDGRLQFVVTFAQLDLDTLSTGDWLNLREALARFLGLVPGLGASHKLILAFTNVGRELSPMALTAAGRRVDLFQPMFSFGITGIATDANIGEDAKQLPTWSLADVRAVQADTLAWLRSLTHPDTPGESWVPHALPLSGEVSLSNGHRAVCVIAPLRQLFFWHLLWLLLAEPHERIHRCPECETIFFRVKKQVYCSRQCGNRATQRRWRERHEASTPSPASLPEQR